MNKYLKIVNNRQNKRFSKLNTQYFHINESLMKIKNIERDDLSKAFMSLSRQLQKFITIDAIVDYIKFGKPIITYDKLNGILKAEQKKTCIIVFDTETTGLIKKSTDKNFRNQIYEMAAITYDYSLNEAKNGDRVDFFHSKVADINLNPSNSVTKLTEKLKKSLNSEIEIDKLQAAYEKAAAKEKYNPDVQVFKDAVDDKYKPFAYDLIKMLKIKSLREMTKADKEKFVDFWTNEEYDVKMHNSEIAMITAFFNYVERQEKKFDQVYMIAHNLSFDKDIVIGAIEDAVKYWQKRNDNPEMLSKSQNLLIKANMFFDNMNSSDTLNGFKSLFNEKKYIEKIDLLVKELKVYAKKRNIPKGEKGFVSKLLIMLSKIPKTKDPKFRTTSLGQVAPAGINKDWHTAVNDVFVTVQTTKMYFTMPIIISILIKISETYEKSGTVIFFPSIKIPTSLIKFAIRSKFHHAYKRVKDKIEAEKVTVPFWAKNTEKDEISKKSPEKIYKYKITHPDFPDITDIESAKKEAPNAQGKDMLEKLSLEKDFIGIDSEIKKAERIGKIPDLQKEMKKMGVNVSTSVLHNIAKEGGFLANDENVLIEKLSAKNKELYNDLKNSKNFSIMQEYLKAKKNKQGPKYVTDKLNKKFGMSVKLEQVVEILNQMGLKK